MLFVEGAPGFEHSFLKRAWAADPGLDIDSTVRKGKNEQGTDTYYIQAAESRTNALSSGYPSRPEDLFRGTTRSCSPMSSRRSCTREQQELTRSFVGQRGGGLLVLGARTFIKPGLADTPLEEALPLQLSNRSDTVLPATSNHGMNRAALTAAGETHPIMQLGATLDDTRKRWDSTPTLASTVPLGGPRPGASVLAVTAGAGGIARALVAVQRYGQGRTMIFTGEGAWRWRMMLPSSDWSVRHVLAAVASMAGVASDRSGDHPPARGSRTRRRHNRARARTKRGIYASVKCRRRHSRDVAQRSRRDTSRLREPRVGRRRHIRGPVSSRRSGRVPRGRRSPSGNQVIGTAASAMLIGGIRSGDDRSSTQCASASAAGSSFWRTTGGGRRSGRRCRASARIGTCREVGGHIRFVAHGMVICVHCGAPRDRMAVAATLGAGMRGRIAAAIAIVLLTPLRSTATSGSRSSCLAPRVVPNTRLRTIAGPPRSRRRLIERLEIRSRARDRSCPTRPGRSDASATADNFRRALASSRRRG